MSYNIEIDVAAPRINVQNSDHLFKYLANMTAPHTHNASDDVYAQLTEHEKAAGISMGESVAILNFKLPALTRRFVCLTTLRDPVTLKSIDNQPVDIVCLFISPEQDGNIHLRGLSRMSRLLRRRDLQQRLRDAHTEDTIKYLIKNPDGWLMAA